MKVTVNAPAKINLYLNILKKFDDNYHSVEMVMQAVNLYDKITVTTTQSKKISVTSNYDFSRNVKKNTAYMAADEFFKSTKVENPGMSIHLEKKIPVCAGLAGGSTDAAAVLVGLNKIFGTDLTKKDLAQIGAKVGADVPFCVFGGTMLAKGTGTDLSPLLAMPSCYIVLCKPDIFISTKRAYMLSDGVVPSKNNVSAIIDSIKNQDLTGISKKLYNRFETVLKIREVDKIKSLILKSGALASSMSGSGPTVFGIFKEKEKAQKCADFLKETYNETFVCTPINQGCNLNKTE